MTSEEIFKSLAATRKLLYDLHAAKRVDKRKLGKALVDISGLLGAMSCPDAALESEPLAVVEVIARKHPERHHHFAVIPFYFQAEGDEPIPVTVTITERVDQ